MTEERFTARQLEIIELVGGKGFSYKRVGLRLGISPHTVEDHAEAIRARAGLHRMNPRDALHRIYLELRFAKRAS